MSRCGNCGSANHQTHDCAKPYTGWREREPAPLPEASPAVESAPKPSQGAGNGGFVALDPANWPGGPGICPVERLPAYPSEQAAQARLSPGYSPKRRWQCAKCGQWHQQTEPGGDDKRIGGPSPERERKQSFPFVRAGYWENARSVRTMTLPSKPAELPAAPAKATPVVVNKKVVGKVADGVFHKTVRASEHFLRKPPAIAFDRSSVEDAQSAGATVVEVVDEEAARSYWATLATVKEHGFAVDRGHGAQVALTLGHWRATRYEAEKPSKQKPEAVGAKKGEDLFA